VGLPASDSVTGALGHEHVRSSAMAPLKKCRLFGFPDQFSVHPMSATRTPELKGMKTVCAIRRPA